MRNTHLVDNQDTIIALATAPGRAAISVLRISGEDAISITNKLFKGKNLEKQEGHTLHFGTLMDGEIIVDEVLVSLFRTPKSYTGENSIEISCHGSPFIVQKIIKLYLANGVRYAKAGEFTKRAFSNGKFDLAQAEAVADLIASDSDIAHKAALNQMRGGFSNEIKTLREKLIHFASMIELELDFSEEDVEFADRGQLSALIDELEITIQALINSFDLGNVIKNGIPTVIAGKPNAGKSTLLNALLNEEKAIVSEIAGTTRDFIEDELIIGGISFRFIDTAGLRHTDDKVEAIGVQRTYEKMRDASLIIYLFDISETSVSELKEETDKLEKMGIPYLAVANKIDLLESKKMPEAFADVEHLISISASDRNQISILKDKLLEVVSLDSFSSGNTIVTNARHYESLVSTMSALQDVRTGIASQISGDFLAIDIRSALHHLGEITGEITTDDLLGNIFSKFCIGK
ncbi:tRNA uridine-5-carboxymethylaminomethyl(34) synthesis GTPase MnmE [Flammeovirgaceae bacterium SG7u.111]|nr:tRNA uridine-5-carboxymethylaminomethyl(34) synthesis GTPase MnmE [Flammeovirgaceae bacterium SG7u.132]WPO33593.1 tRNA uridine-5-carboxymethylaminomethyl(34) synthesis GTPase MnmE [Flammeovirgaceae bacterium SG7u.111]